MIAAADAVSLLLIRGGEGADPLEPGDRIGWSCITLSTANFAQLCKTGQLRIGDNLKIATAGRFYCPPTSGSSPSARTLCAYKDPSGVPASLGSFVSLTKKEQRCPAGHRASKSQFHLFSTTASL
jgi:hypothetical protein